MSGGVLQHHQWEDLMSSKLRLAILEMVTQIEAVALECSNTDLLFRARALRLELNMSW